jgi:phosphate starvation-inducible protein PhoH and related proteins
MPKKQRQKMDAEPPQPKDDSPYVFQRDKIAFNINVKELPWTDKQKGFMELALDKKTKILFVRGSAGTSKTLISVYCALKLLGEKKVSDIVFVRSAVESADSKLGYLPGDLEEKFGVYLTPFHDKLDELLPTDEIKRLEKDKRFTHLPVNFARGLHFAARAIVVDEAQNLSEKELLTILTRIGPYCKVFICGDPMQSDLHNGKGHAFQETFNLFNDELSKDNGIFTFEFTDDDIIRSEIVRFIVKKFQSKRV